ncbi:MAG: radical SAM protein [Gemmatimonadota bacterium]
MGRLPVLDLPTGRDTGSDGLLPWTGQSVASAPEAHARRAGHLPHVVAWNLTRRCNLACSHCYIAAGSWHTEDAELDTAEVFRITDEILAVNPAPMFVLSGGEPLLRPDLEDIARQAARGGATVVVGTNGTLLTEERIAGLKDAGVRGVAISVDSLDARYHDRFRHGGGALEDTLAAVGRLREAELDFIVQTSLTAGNRAEIGRIAQWAADAGAVSFNLYFLVATGRGERMRGLTPEENEAVLLDVVELERRYRGRMMVRTKCQPQLMRHVTEGDPDSPLLGYETRCPCGIHYCRITPEGKLTPCPYAPVVAGDLRSESFADVWFGSPALNALRGGELGGKCGACEYRRVCGGCRARALADTGDLLGADESCAYEPTGEAAVVEPERTITYGASFEGELPWDEDARERIARAPSFVRGVVSQRVESFARARGHTRVTTEVMDEVRRSMPVDFSKRMPFFMRGDR